ncbi:MAG: PQQ-binding-like beta-propeller repeat protein, partial [Verrucomicrobia bacterium]|nr:PQQ-binding-like beta-propeller repeat protein [Verrucomicrobiota bacterium]
ANFGGTEQIILLTTGNKGGLNSFDPKSGKNLWSSQLYKNRIPITIPVQLGKDRLFVSGGYDGGSKMLSVKKSGDGFEVKELWTTKKGSQIHPPFVIDDHLYFLANENSNHKTATRRKKGGLVCYDLEGKELWSTGNDPFMGRGASLYADGTLIIQDGENGILRLVDPSPKGFKLLAEANVFGTDPKSKKDLRYWSPMALSNGKLLMRGQRKLLCVELKK